MNNTKEKAKVVKAEDFSRVKAYKGYSAGLKIRGIQIVIVAPRREDCAVAWNIITGIKNPESNVECDESRIQKTLITSSDHITDPE